jgi:hypothetical protein
MEGNEHGSYDWVEKTFETLEISTAYEAQTIAGLGLVSLMNAVMWMKN